MPINKSKIIVIGIGNEFRGDDGIGIFAARKLKEKLPSTFEITECSGAGVELLDLWNDYGTVFIIDAMYSGKTPGTIFCFDADKESLPRNTFNYSSHSFSLAETVELAKELNRLPTRLVIFGIEGRNFEHGRSLSFNLENVYDELLEKILNGKF